MSSARSSAFLRNSVATARNAAARWRGVVCDQPWAAASAATTASVTSSVLAQPTCAHICAVEGWGSSCCAPARGAPATIAAGVAPSRLGSRELMASEVMISALLRMGSVVVYDFGVELDAEARGVGRYDVACVERQRWCENVRTQRASAYVILQPAHRRKGCR